MRTSIVLMGCSQPSRLAPERAPAVEACCDVCVQHILGLVADRIENSFERVVAGASRTEPETVRLETSFPFGFQGKPRQRLSGAVVQGRDAKRSLFRRGARFGNPDPANGACPQMRRQASGQIHSLVGDEALDPVYASSFLTPVVLCHFADGEASGRPGPHQESLQMVDGRDVTSTGGSVDPLLELEDLLLEGFPGQLLPFIR